MSDDDVFIEYRGRFGNRRLTGQQAKIAILAIWLAPAVLVALLCLAVVTW